MKAPRPHRALLVAVLLLSPALIAACGKAPREGAESDQAALHKALLSVAAPQGLTVSKAAAQDCTELSPDCPTLYSAIRYAVDHGNPKPCAAVVALQGKIPAAAVRWRGAAPDGNPAAEVTAVRPAPAVLMAACTKSMSIRHMFKMTSDLDQHAVPVKWGRAQLMVLPAERSDMTVEPTDLEVHLSYEGPDAYAEPQ